MTDDFCYKLVRQAIQDASSVASQLMRIVDNDNDELGRTEHAAIAYLSSASAKMTTAEALFQSIHTLQGDRRAECVFAAFRLFESALLQAYAGQPSYRQALRCLDQLVMAYQDSVFYPID